MSNIPASIHLPASATARRRVLARLWVIIPLLVFFGIAALLLVRLGAGDASRIPSALIGREAPATDLPSVTGLERNADIATFARHGLLQLNEVLRHRRIGMMRRKGAINDFVQ